MPGIPTHLSGDSGRLRQILLNLLNNAVTYTDRGHIGITVTQVTSNPTGNSSNQPSPTCLLKFTIDDTGTGISPDKLNQIFEHFTQADNSSTRHYGGAGLGLAICKNLVELMGGHIGVESQLDHGSVFWFTVQLSALPNLATPLTPRELPQDLDVISFSTNNDTLSSSLTPHTPSKQAKVLLVEDNLVNQKVAAKLLETLHTHIDIAEKGQVAVEKAGRQGYDIIFMDCQMPVMDGYEATRTIRDNNRPNQQTPIIAITANAMPGDREKCLAAGMNDHIAKPVSKKVLENTLNTFVAEHDCAQVEKTLT